MNLLLTLSTASLGFALTLSRDSAIREHGWGRCFLVLGALALVVSIALGVLCVLNRLKDFRITADIARKREKMEAQAIDQSIIDQKLGCERHENRNRGERSKTILDWQAWVFAAGIAFVTAAFLCIYNKILF